MVILMAHDNFQCHMEVIFSVYRPQKNVILYHYQEDGNCITHELSGISLQKYDLPNLAGKV